MNYEIGLSPEEIAIMRQSLDIIQISGKSARVIAGLQDKLDEAIMNIQFTIEAEEAKKQEELQKLVEKNTTSKLKS
jgi:hypothetical protein